MNTNFEDMNPASIKKPQKGDQLFAVDEDWSHNACLNWCNDPWELYIVGYKDAADILANSALSGDGAPDALVYPIIFLYRQYIELRLKVLLKEGRYLLDIEHKAKREHKLEELWNPVLVILRQVRPEENDDELIALDKLMNQFIQVDPDSTVFRYPTDLDGSPLIDKSIKQISLKNLKDIIESMSTILEGAAIVISEHQQHKYDSALYLQARLNIDLS